MEVSAAQGGRVAVSEVTDVRPQAILAGSAPISRICARWARSRMFTRAGFAGKSS